MDLIKSAYHRVISGFREMARILRKVIWVLEVMSIEWKVQIDCFTRAEIQSRSPRVEFLS